MATLSLTIPDAIVPRIRDALGSWNSAVPPVWVPATVAEIQTILKAYLKGRVIERDASVAAKTKHDEVSAEVW